MKDVFDYMKARLGAVDGWKTAFTVAFAMLFAVAPDLALAQGGGLGAGLCELIEMATGQAGAAIATAGIIVIGIGALLGRVSWGMAVMIAAGIAAIFGAGTIANLIATSSGTAGTGCGAAGW